jgi:sugar phosphate isomerase/epimerase
LPVANGKEIYLGDNLVKLGFLTSVLPENTLEQIAKWGAESGFQAIEIACWPREKAARRYAGVTHIEATTLDKAGTAKIRKMLDGYGLTISSLAYYPNLLHPDPDHRDTVSGYLIKVLEAAAMLEVPVVGTFVGKN